MMDYALVFIDEIKPEIGETLLTLDLFGVERGFIVVGEYVDVEQLKGIISNTSMKNFEILEKDYIQIREKMISIPEVEKSGEFVKIPIDHFFSVRSVGTVILGKVDKGTRITSYNVCYTKLLRIFSKVMFISSSMFAITVTGVTSVIETFNMLEL